MKKLLSFLVMALCFVACQNELTMGVSNADLVDVVLNLEAPELGVTRLDGDDQKGGNSAFGGIDFMSDANWEAYDLRYTLEVYGKDKNGVEKLAGQRMVNCLDKYAPTSFQLRLAPNRDYKFVVFADYVAEGSAEAEDKLAIADLYYTTADLSNIACKTGAGWVPMNEVRDAYFVSKTLKVENSLNEALTLTRPFGKLRVITTDIDKIDGYATPARVEIQYTDAVYKSFNALSGNLNDEMMSGDELKYNYNIGKTIPYNAGYDALATHQTLFADYLLAKEGEQIPVNFTMAVYDDGNRLIHTKDFNTQIPVQRNHLTTIIGDLLTTQAEVNIFIDDDFIDEFVNATMTPALSAPEAVGEPKVEGNVITIEWDAVEGAGNYSVLVNNEIPVFVEDTTYTFTGEYETTYTIQVTAIPADETAYTHSAATVFTVTTGEEPVTETYKLYFNNLAEWSKVYAHIWANEGEDLGLEASEWPGRELTKTEEVDGVTYYVFQLPAEATGKTVNVVFNDGAGTQTKDLAGVVEGNLFFDNYVEPVAPSDVVLYLQPNANWNVDGARFAAYFFGNGESWVDMTLVEGETNIYAVTVPAGFENIIFCRMNPGAAANNWNNKWNQTADLKVPTDGTNLFTVAEDTWDKGGGAWSVYTPVVEPTTLATPEVKAEVVGLDITLTWEVVENAAQYGITVGTEMPVFVEGTTYTFNATEYETEYTFNVVAVPADEEKFAVSEAAVVTAKTEAEPEGPVPGSELSVADFLELGDTANEYVLTGKITRVVNTTYGNFDLTDATGTVYVYGLLTPDGAAQKQWAAAGLREGDTITIKGKYSVYNGSPQIKNATYVSHVAAPFIEATAVSVEAAETTATIAVSANVAWTVTCDAEWVETYTVSGVDNGTIDVVMEANESEEDRVASFTLSAEGVEDVVVKLTQKGVPAEGEVVGGNDDFDTIASTNTSYVSGKTTAGWNYKNCAIFKGGTANSGAEFSIIGDASNRALCMNGKTSAVGSITSPTLTTGCGTLTFNYGLPFSDTKIKFRVDIIQDGETIHTFTINNTSASKLTKYSHEEVVNVAGEFQIVFTNLSPSNSTSNKDRTAIWDVEWTGCN